MAHALTLGRRGMGRVWPNPAVGCVIVADGRVVGRGWTADGGRPHAETIALAQAGDAVRGATAYVTLEPCSHHGKTPPCAEALIAAGVARVVVALGDPDPRVAGRGIAALQAAGIEVITDVCADQARADHAGFLARVVAGRPFLTLKLASSFDGRIATATGESQWITGADARRAVHALRARHDAVMVGAGTARADDPTLTVRGIGVTRQPVRVVVSGRLDLPVDSALLRSLDVAPLWICHGGDVADKDVAAWEKRGAVMLPCGSAADVMAQLGAAGLTRVLCEGGGSLAASLVQADVVDQLVGFSAGVALGADGTPAIGALGVKRLGDAPRFVLVDHRRIGADLMHTWQRA
ncbi:bifunctional diaminohydroxyphosphoribosylaminopyrimidine deaminase/5-amino-6-(5-phosphoribosylamino)uracil reductase RibD [Octadecabacter sp. R77987]|uniref:bifunctional diaminohydroxyphosphoribosylaminopyrimidine deaminase/5-amino-6-(5-phosphoribosylamino)uracil reductase RibD n=1 Tax=Octadecabacter sp. R77987 TaxID=3093874 RepID=UPI00366AB353